MSLRTISARLSCALIFVVALSASPAWAQADSGIRIAVIDVQRLLAESDAGKQALEDLRGLRDRKQQEGLSLQQELTQLRDQIAEGRLSLSEDRLGALETDLEAKAIAFQRFQDDADRELQTARAAAFERIENQVLPIIDQVGQDLGYTAIFNKFQSGLLFAVDSIDITAEVLSRFNTSGSSTE